MALGLLRLPGFAGVRFVALAGRGHAVAGCVPRVAHPVVQHTFSGAAHTPVANGHKTKILYFTNIQRG